MRPHTTDAAGGGRRRGGIVLLLAHGEGEDLGDAEGQAARLAAAVRLGRWRLTPLTVALLALLTAIHVGRTPHGARPPALATWTRPAVYL